MSQEPKAITEFSSYLIDVVCDGRLWYNSSQMTVHVKGLQQNEEKQEIKTGSGIIMHMGKILLWHAHKVKTTENKQRRHKEQRSINRWPYLTVHQVYLVVQLGLG